VTLTVHLVTPVGISIVTDTLCIRLPERSPSAFISKARLVPHVGVAVVAAGADLLSIRLAAALTKSSTVRNLDDVAEIAPPVLRAAWQKIADDVGVDVRAMFGTGPGGGGRGSSVSVYGQGRDRRFRWYQFDSLLDFEAIAQGVGRVSMPPPPDGAAINYNTVSEMIDHAVALKAQHDLDSTAAGEWPCIGGELWLTEITETAHGAPRLTAERVHVFDDRETLWEAIQEQRTRVDGRGSAAEFLSRAVAEQFPPVEMIA
jgi:hypothetical protein